MRHRGERINQTGGTVGMGNSRDVGRKRGEEAGESHSPRTLGALSGISLSGWGG